MENGFGLKDGFGITYEEHFASKRPDGRYTSTLAAFMAQLRDMQPALALPKELDDATFSQWQQNVKETLRRQLAMPAATPQPTPVKLETVQRDGYRVEKWEFYPDNYSAVPFMVMIPDGADENHKVPGVMCYLGSGANKEFACQEPQSEHPNRADGKYPERNRMGLYMVQNGMAAFVFENPGTAETSVLTPPEVGKTHMYTRTVLCHGLLDSGFNYVGLTVFQRLQFLKYLDTFPFVDQKKLGISAHSLGTEAAIAVGLLDERIKAIVFNDFLHDDRRRYVAITEQAEPTRLSLSQDIGNWHIMPGKMSTYGYQDMCAAFAPRYLSLNEGGSYEMVETVRRAYRFCNAENHFQVNYYPAYSDPETRTKNEDMPLYGLTSPQYYRDYSYVIVSDHSFRKDAALALLKSAFSID
ncbi:MAG: hypothetical protein IKU07_07915 [Oscillospiraceae bacterium]|nr:hypothetical protein [Oscillospiraceae bacterium]